MQAEINKYRLIINNRPDYFLYIMDGRQYYSRDFAFDNGFNYSYKIHWDVSKAREIIERDNIEIGELEVDQLFPQVDVNSLDILRVNNPSTEPIIVAYYDPSNMYVIIDGNHRVTAAHKSGQESIEAYVLYPCQHMDTMVDEYFIKIYKIHHNITTITNFMVGNIDEYMYSEEGYNECLYNIIASSEQGLINRVKQIIKEVFIKNK